MLPYVNTRHDPRFSCFVQLIMFIALPFVIQQQVTCVFELIRLKLTWKHKQDTVRVVAWTRMCSEDLIIRKLSAEQVVIMVVEVNYCAVLLCAGVMRVVYC